MGGELTLTKNDHDKNDSPKSDKLEEERIVQLTKHLNNVEYHLEKQRVKNVILKSKGLK